MAKASASYPSTMLRMVPLPVFDREEIHTTPNASIASATFLKPAMLAPFT
jgi:hypothetical protein